MANNEQVEKEVVTAPYGRTGLADIVEAARKQRELEISGDPDEVEAEEGEEDVSQESEKVNSESDKKPVNTIEGEETPAGEEAPGDPPDEDLVTIIVDGEEREVPRSQVYEQGVRTLQKEAAADKRLEDANRRLREIEAREAQLAQANIEQRALAPRQTSNAPPSEQDVDVQARARQIIDKILDGDEEEAAKALAEVMGRGNATPFDQSTLVPQVAQQVQRQLEGQKALQSFKTSYPEIVNDPFLFQRADAETIKVHQEHPEYSTEELLLEAGRRTKDWVLSLSGSQSATAGKQTTTSTKDKVDRKRTTENLKSAHARNPAARETPPPSRSDVVAAMRKRRGLPEVG